MGLDFSHCEARWAYSGCHRFRQRLATQVGFDLNAMDGFDGTRSWDEINDPIVPLLNHSDCDGVLTPEECSLVYPRLEQLIPFWNDDDRDKRNALWLIEGMKLCVEQNEGLEFI
ncbi:hypothetical protein AV540_20985 [Brevibacillus parabrevis]|uniref:hypothetical protein n=1 Tax=Brevibacillus parabrevis TaxID=54914 RepID=UPI0007AB3775|nr:hypothetical protein [Brevibacillus parabrevis]KZE47058.1 hypothetical protein AV540_20985 [Brevibacillus parabrevis]